MRIITAIYYLAYPDSMPADPLLASSEVYIEAMESEDCSYDFDYTYSLHVCTPNYISMKLQSEPFFLAHRTLVVKRFEDPEIHGAIEALLPRIHEFALRK